LFDACFCCQGCPEPGKGASERQATEAIRQADEARKAMGRRARLRDAWRNR
jgi:hypothetical protein